MAKLSAYARLMRLHRPMPILLLLWPTYWALWSVSGGYPGKKLLIIFTLGVVIVRTLGCIINDLSDRTYDSQVKRTERRPLATGEIKPKEAWALFTILGLIAFGLVLFLNVETILMSLGALALTCFYPLCKRFFSLPQLVLGMTFNYGVLMASTAVLKTITFEAFLLYLAAIIWTLAYDTIYALADKPYDIKLKLKSSALTFGRYDIAMIIILQQITLLLLAYFGYISNFSWVFYIGLIICEVLFFYQYLFYVKRDIVGTIKAFSDNHWIGLVLFFVIVLQFSYTV
ncbi:4-hydroxybenzoate octaprenyltransferase [Thiotrichales bacterium 19S3-7]|nr:4-hydroxybenzoate octaprenyltransferase [Thiotrichales bacterium 19S3-7]MCF6800953.1 4-hydroxybenzoate octaprenyltransferase [Thiotrichales bacterium 19S3-11]